MNPITWDEFADLYCERQLTEPIILRARLKELVERFTPDGFLMAECEVMDSSRFGDRVILPYGGKATLKEPPPGMFSPRGIASDQSRVIATIPASEV